MMGLGRERRLNCRLYVDRQADATVVEKLDRLLVEKHFLNQTELIKHGIELVYQEVYEQGSVNEKVDISDADLCRLAEAIADGLKPELQSLCEGAEARILKELAGMKLNSGVNVEEDCSGATGADEVEVVAKEVHSKSSTGSGTKSDATVPEEKVLSGMAISFLKRLNDD